MGQKTNHYKEILETVAEMCDVPTDKILSESKMVQYVNARHFFWLAARQATGDTYRHIAGVCKELGANFVPATIGLGSTRMLKMVMKDRLWSDRWGAITDKFCQDAPQAEVTEIKIIVPKGTKDKFNIKISEAK